MEKHKEGAVILVFVPSTKKEERDATARKYSLRLHVGRLSYAVVSLEEKKNFFKAHVCFDFC